MTFKQIGFIAFVSVLGGLSLVYALDKQDRIDCLKWQREASVLQGFYLTKDEAAQCAALNISVNARTR